MLNAPFCPVKQKLRKNECEVSMVKIPQHKVTKFNKFFRDSFSYFLSNPTKIFTAALFGRVFLACGKSESAYFFGFCTYFFVISEFSGGSDI